MCGIAGFWQGNQTGGFSPSEALRRMAACLARRGPDGEGFWSAPEWGIHLGHRRLAVIDLSPAGAQPMLSASGRYAIVYNGEIYNTEQIRESLERKNAAPLWRGHSDTEVLLGAIEGFGVEAALKLAQGMFALAVWDRRDHRLVLARDRLGEKPLYYGKVGNNLVFASELSAIETFPGFSAEISRSALALLIQRGYIPAPYTIFDGIHKLPAGHWLEVREPRETLPASSEFWSLKAVAESGSKNVLDMNGEEAADALENELKLVIRSQMVSDVPIGAFLSGGIDSSTVVALMQTQATSSVRSFSIGFEDERLNEAKHAAQVAKQLGTDHTELYVTGRDALNIVPELPKIYSEPFGDSSQIPTCLLSSLTRRHVTVAMSGDGGDEIFGGYNRYLLGPRQWAMLDTMPNLVRQAIGSALEHLPRSLDRVVQSLLSVILHRLGHSPDLAQKTLKVVKSIARANSIDDIYVLLLYEWPDAYRVVCNARLLQTLIERRHDWPRLDTPEERMMTVDALTYLPDDIMVKVDRASMAASLETRAPLMDVRIVEFAARLPLDLKIKNGRGKLILRSVLNRYLPQHVLERPKRGFAAPVDEWLKTKLRGWAEDLIGEARLKNEGYFDATAIRAAWDSHISGHSKNGNRLWPVLMFQAWQECRPRHQQIKRD